MDTLTIDKKKLLSMWNKSIKNEMDIIYEFIEDIEDQLYKKKDIKNPDNELISESSFKKLIWR